MASTPVRPVGCYLAIAWLLLMQAIALGGAMVQDPHHAPAFTLKDQHQTTHDYQFPRPKISVLIFADYAGSAQLENWIRPIYGRYRDTITIDGVAELSSVPRLIRGMVRAAFRDRLARPVMLDWSGSVSTDYRYQKGEANLFVIDPDGRILLKVVGAISDAKFQRVRNTIDRQLNRNRP